MDVDVETSDMVSKVTINGELTINNVAELKAALMRSFDAADHIVLNFEKVTEIDLAGLQLLCSAHRTVIRLNKQFTLKGILPEAFKHAVEDAGFCRDKGCVLDNNKSCLWIRGLSDG